MPAYPVNTTAEANRFGSYFFTFVGLPNGSDNLYLLDLRYPKLKPIAYFPEPVQSIVHVFIVFFLNFNWS